MNQDNNRNITFMLIGGTLLVFCFLYLARRVVTPFFIAFALAYLLDPLVDRLENYKIPRTPAVVLLLVSVFLLFLACGFLLVPAVSLQVENLAKSLPDYIGILQEWIRPVLEEIAGLDQAKVEAFLKEGMTKFGELPLKILTLSTTFLWDSISSLFTVILMVANLVIIPVAMFYLLRDFDGIMASLLNLVPERFRKRTLDVFREIDSVLAAFVRGQLMVALLMGTLYSIGLYFCETPLSLLIGFAAGLANMIPYLGLVIGFVPAAALTFLQTQDWVPVMGVAGVFAAVQALEGMVITPRVVGDKIGLHPVAIILAVLLGGEFFGLLGVIIAAPAVAVLNVLLRRGLSRYKKTPFYTSS